MAAGANIDIDEVLARTDLRSLLTEISGAPVQAGRSSRWHCPVSGHNDANPSVTVSVDGRGKERWRCWSGDTDHRGDAVDAVRVSQGSTFVDALKMLADRAGVRPGVDLPAVRPRPVAVQPKPAVMNRAVAAYVHEAAGRLRTVEGRPQREFLKARGISDGTARANLIGADPGASRLARRFGLPAGEGPGVTFPALDRFGKVAFVQTRMLDPETVGRKFDAPSAAMAPNPRVGFMRPDPDRPPRSGLLIVAEGLPDALVAAEHGFVSAGIMGSQAPSELVAHKISVAASSAGLDVVLAFDADRAGRVGLEVMGRHLAAVGTDFTTLVLPDGHDLTDYAAANPDWPQDLYPTISNQREATGLASAGVEIDI